MPQVAQHFAAGHLSLSKVKEITRLAGRMGDEQAAGLALVATAAQLSMLISTFVRLDDETLDDRAVDHPTEVIRDEDRLTAVPLGNGRARLIIDVSEVDAARVLTAVSAERDRLVRAQKAELEQAELDGDGAVELECHTNSPYATRVDAFLNLIGADEPARAQMAVHVSVDELERVCSASRGSESVEEVDNCENAAVDTDEQTTAESAISRHTAFVEGYGSIGRVSVGRLACTSPLVGVLIDDSANVLALGRSRRLASGRQMTALKVRDIHCQFPGCGRTAGLEAHHARPWSHGGPTDLNNLLLLCRHHHQHVHRARIRIEFCGGPFAGARTGTSGFAFFDSSGRDLSRARQALHEPAQHELAWDASETAEATQAVEDIGETAGEETAADPMGLQTRGGGADFHLEPCIWWMFNNARSYRRTGGGDQLTAA